MVILYNTPQIPIVGHQDGFTGEGGRKVGRALSRAEVSGLLPLTWNYLLLVWPLESSCMLPHAQQFGLSAIPKTKHRKQELS